MNNALSAFKENVIDTVEKRVKEYTAKNEIDLPDNYSYPNAMKSAWLEIQEVKNKEGKPAFEVCTQASVANALLNMIVQGLNPAKKQCYFIVYGNQLVLQRSYFGTMHVAKAVCPQISDIYADVVYEDDIFEYEKVRGRTIISKHVQKLQNINPDKIIAAYCTIVYKDNTEQSTIMTYEECKQSWRKSRMSPVDSNGDLKAGSVHKNYTAEMMKKTVVNKACKYIINSSDDSSIMIAQKIEDEVKQAAVEDEVQEKANSVVIDIEDNPVSIDTETGEVKENVTQEEHLNDEPNEPQVDF
ncbi:MAG: recombinase RecT [Oscillospiraceae bacterium]